MRFLESKSETQPSKTHAIDCSKVGWQALREPVNDNDRRTFHHVQCAIANPSLTLRLACRRLPAGRKSGHFE